MQLGKTGGAFAFLCAGLAIAASADAEDSNNTTVHNGSFGEGSFQNDWKGDLPHAWDSADRWRGRINDRTTTRWGTENLHGGAHPDVWYDSSLHSSGNDSFRFDNTDLLFVATHSGAWCDTCSNPYVSWTMGDEDERAFSKYMRLGNNTDYLRILISRSCDAMSLTEPDQNQMIKRWDSIFEGGLFAALASHDLMYFSYWSRNDPRTSAQNMLDGDKIRYAWLDAMVDGSTSAMALFASTSSSSCSARRSGMEYKTTYTRNRDSAVDYYCWTKRDDS